MESSESYVPLMVSPLFVPTMYIGSPAMVECGCVLRGACGRATAAIPYVGTSDSLSFTHRLDDRVRCGLLARRHAELRQKSRDVMIDGFGRYAQARGNRLVAEVVRQQGEDFRLPCREAEQIALGRRTRAHRDATGAGGAQSAPHE